MESYHAPAASNPVSIVAQAALVYADRGIPVFPCAPCKRPYTPRGFKDASTDPRRITAWWTRWPDALIGIPTGERTGLLVLDVDDADALAALEAERGPLPPTRTHRTGSGGMHFLYRYPEGMAIRNSAGLLASGLDVRAEGGYIVAPPSTSQKGAYTVLDARPRSDAPVWLLEELGKPQGSVSARAQAVPGCVAGGPVGIDTAGPAIPEGGRNQTLTRIAGTLHDGTRDLDALTRELQNVNDARCTPPLPAAEVARIATSIHARTPCKPRPEVGPRILALVDALEAIDHPIMGTDGASGWAVYMAGLQLLRRYGWKHPDGIALSVDVRTWAQAAGVSGGTVSNVIHRSPLLKRVDQGSGRHSGTVVFVVPKGLLDNGHQLKHSSTGGGVKNTEPSRSVYVSAHPLYRLRWSTAGRRSRRGVVTGTQRIREVAIPATEGIARIGKSRAAILHAVAECGAGAEVSRQALAKRLGRKPESMRAPLRWLVEAGLLVRVRHGHYSLPPDFTQRVEDARELGREPEADRLQIARHERERAGWKRRNENREDLAPTELEMCEIRKSYPERRREHVERAIAALFAERPEYRGRRVGQIVCALIKDYIGPGFPRGPDGMPKDHEVEAILNGISA